MATMITGLFKTPSDAAAAVQTLEAKGVPTSKMSIVARDSVKKEAFAIDSHSKLPEGVAIGAGTGGAIGALVAGLTAVGTIATGGVGLLAAGPIVAALAGAGAGAAAGGTIGGAIGAALPEHEVKRYTDALDRGSVIVGVDTENDAVHKDVVRDTFKRFNAETVSTA